MTVRITPAYPTNAVAVAAEKSVAADMAAREAKLVLRAQVRKAHAKGVSEYELARAAGVTRATVRKWLGKD